MKKAFNIRRFSRAQLEKTFLRTEVEMKANGLLNSTRAAPGRRHSSDNLPTPDAVNRITAQSTNLTYKEVKPQYDTLDSNTNKINAKEALENILDSEKVGIKG